MKCSFCNSEIPKGKAKMYVKNDGTILYFDKKKCEKYYFMGKKSKKLKWTKKRK